MNFKKTTLILVSLMFCSANVFANTRQADNIGEAVRTQTQWEQEKALAKKAKEKIKPKPTEILPFGVKEGGPEILVNKIDVRGDKKISYEKILDVILKYEGKKMTLADLYRIANEITKLYEKEGFVTSYAYLPEQEVSTGNIKINVVEGKVGKVKVRGNKYFKDELLTRDLDHRLAGKVLDYDVLEKILRELNFNSDRTVKAYLMPGETEKETDILLVVEDKKPGHVSLDVNNTGTDATGNERFGLGYTNSNLLGIDDEWMIKNVYGTGYEGVYTSYTVPVYDNRTKIGVNYQYAHINVGGDFKDLDVKGTANNVQIFVQRELFQDKNMDIDGKIGFSKKRLKNERLDVATGVDDLSVLNLDAFADVRDSWGRTFIDQGLDIGIADFLGSSDKGDSGLNRIDSGSEFTKFRGSVDRYSKLDFLPSTILHLKGRYQYSNNNLPSAEQFSLGGFNNVRGYGEGEYSGDIGGIVSAEVFMPVPFIPDFKMPFKDETFKQSVQLVGFYDYGYAKLNKPYMGEAQHMNFAGVGAGLRIHFFKDTYGRFEWGFPVGDDSLGNNPEFHFMIQTELM